MTRLKAFAMLAVMILFSACGSGGGTNVSVNNVGHVRGTVKLSSLPISGVSVQIGGKTATTDASGIYSITDLAVGSITITATKTNYKNYNGTVTITKGTTVNHDIQMDFAPGAAGSLDTTYGNGGIVTTTFVNDNETTALIIQADGKYVAAGVRNSAFALDRYNTDGTLDLSFGIGGKVTTAIGSHIDYAKAVTIQSDGKLVVVGNYYDGSIIDLAIVRYNTNGTLDPSFGVGGKVTTDLGGDDVANALCIQPDGKIVVAGHSFGAIEKVFLLVRYNTDGTLDTTFGTGGMVTTDFGGNGSANFLGICSDGKLVAAGIAASYFVLARYNTDGTLDTTFGNDGKVINTDTGTTISALGIQPDGKILTAGSSSTSISLVRYDSNGLLDAAFGTGGKVITRIDNSKWSSDYANALVIQADGKIVAAGRSSNGSSSGGDAFALVRYNTNGTLDTTFGDGGVVITDTGTDVSELSIQPDGKIVAVGRTVSGNDRFIVIAKYLL